jgi:hypothetical protein
VVFDGLIDRRSREKGVEAAQVGGGGVLVEDGLDDGVFRDRLAGLRRVFAVRLVVVHVKTEDVFVLDRVGNGVLVQAALEQVVRGFVAGLLAGAFATCR